MALAPGAGAQDDPANANLIPGQPAPQIDSDVDGRSDRDEIFFGGNPLDPTR